ncbi:MULTISPECIES: hypothetical protein [Burkholderia]|jgi:hypothetical protein|uniref:Uncharacterized protein n=1 Tax=Burkholderia cenocepacia TaxID=95486 RepID=A0A144WRU5_9BURK|nr:MULTISPECIES: hypothetical protein [Burkholderia]AIO43244.1 hypothetical protein DM42_7110 [Burkholderia cepacia]MCM3011826.1 hypothetical protein [Bacillus subtilis]ALV60850.1 hypothetical protein TQ36_31885 [Burkholderia cenocepacia]AMU10596.1 hypothetical protein A2T82_29970 [Burkholderia cenocepacia]AMU18737.1 hypothetical protein A3203_36845 [Burkholderia cenocepacia]
MKDSTRHGHDAPAHERQPDPQPPLKEHDQTRTRHSERHIDKQLEDTFPASDPPATGGVTRIEPDTPPGTHDDGPWQEKRESDPE